MFSFYYIENAVRLLTFLTTKEVRAGSVANQIAPFVDTQR